MIECFLIDSQMIAKLNDNVDIGFKIIQNGMFQIPLKCLGKIQTMQLINKQLLSLICNVFKFADHNYKNRRWGALNTDVPCFEHLFPCLFCAKQMKIPFIFFFLLFANQFYCKFFEVNKELLSGRAQIHESKFVTCNLT